MSLIKTPFSVRTGQLIKTQISSFVDKLHGFK